MRRLRLLGPAYVDESLPTVLNTTTGAQDRRDTAAVPRFRSKRTVALLGYLVVERRSVARDMLATLLWPDEDSSAGRSNLRRELHNLAQILPDCWEMDRQAVAFVPSPDVSIDLDTLRQLEIQQRWQEAADLLGGEFLEGLHLDDNLEFENWLLRERERWHSHAQAILTRVIEGDTRRGRYADALRHTQRLLQLAPWNERAHRQAMRLLAWTGRRGAALRQFETCKQVLREELGVEPTDETTSLYKEIEMGALDLPPQLPTFLTDEGARHEVDRPPFVTRERELAQLDEFLAGALAGNAGVVFVTGDPGCGKTALLDAFARQALEAHPTLLIAGGNCNAYSDLGDPYLPFRDVMAMLTGDVETKWDAGTTTRDHAQRLWTALPFVVQALLDHGPHLLDVLVPGAALLSRAVIAATDGPPWLPRLRTRVGRPGTTASAVDQSYLFQQVTDVLRAVAQQQPLLLILDDFQWADAASISLLFHLGRRLLGADARILIACAYRPEEVAVGRAGERHPLARVLGEFKRTYGDVWVDLDEMDQTEGRRFIDAFLDARPNRLAEGFRATLFRRTGGHPLFTVELIRALQEWGGLLQDDDGSWIEGPALNWDALPARVEAVIAERIDRLEPELLQILGAASVEGEVFTAQVLSQVHQMSQRHLVHRLSHDLERRHHLVREQEEIHVDGRRLSRYRFGHALFQEYVYRRLGRTEQRLLHGEVGVALESLYDGHLDEMAVRLAYHFQSAGDHALTFRYLSLAAERAARLYATDEAIAHYSAALEVAAETSPELGSRARLYRGRGLAWERVGEFDRARSDHKAVLQIARETGDRRLEWRAQLDIGKLWTSRDYDRARICFERALELARSMGDPTVLARSLNWMGNWCLNAENPSAAITHHQEALDIFEGAADRHGLATTLDLLGIASLLSGEITTGVKYYNQATLLFRELRDLPGLASSLTGRGHSGASTYPSLTFLSPTIPINPEQDFEEALHIAREIGSSYGKGWVGWSLGLLRMVQGRFGQALESAHSGLDVATEIRHREGMVASRCVLGMLYTELLVPEEARCHLEVALTMAEELRSRLLIHWATGALAAARSLDGDLSGAQACLGAVLASGMPMDTMYGRFCWARRAELALRLGDPAHALAIVEQLIATAPGMSPGRIITFLWKLKGETLAAMGQIEQACSLLQEAVKNSYATEERFLQWRLHASLGRLYRATGRHPEAEVELAAAQGLVAELSGTIQDAEMKDRFLQRAHDMVNEAEMSYERSRK